MLRVITVPLLLSGTVVLVAAATSLSATTTQLGAATVATPRCVTGAVGLVQNLSGSNVVSVTASNLPSACGGGTLQVTVNNQASSSSGSVVVPAGGGTVTATLATGVPLNASEEVNNNTNGP